MCLSVSVCEDCMYVCVVCTYVHIYEIVYSSETINIIKIIINNINSCCISNSMINNDLGFLIII